MLQDAVYILLILIGYTVSYIVSLYSLAVYIDPDEVETLFPDVTNRRRVFLKRLADDPRVFVQMAMIFKSFTLVVISGLTVLALYPHDTDIGWLSMIELALWLVAVWLIYIVIVEYFPRRSSRRAVNQKMLKQLWVITITYYFCFPIVYLYRIALEHWQGDNTISEDDKDEIVERAIETLADEAGIGEAIVEDDEKEMIGQIFQLDQTITREIMIPRIDITGIDKAMSFREIRSLVERDGHSRYPVYKDTIDKIIGIIYVKDLFNRMPEPGETFSIESYLRKVYLVPETKIIGELLQEFRGRQQHIAIVVDEYGGVAGLVTLEDIIEEIFGEIQDEHDTESVELSTLTDGRYLVSAGMLVEKLQDVLDTEYDQGNYDTVGGLIYDLVGSVPHEGQKIQWHRIEFEVERTDGQRIITVKVRK